MPNNDPKPSPQARWDRNSTNSTLSAMSRVLAVLVFMILIGFAGVLLDRALGTSIWTLVGFLVGIAFAMVGMWYVVKVAEYENRQNGRGGAGLDEEASKDRELVGETLEERNE